MSKQTRFETAQEFKVAAKAYCDNPDIMTVYTKDGPIEAQAMTFDAISEALGWNGGRQSLYDQAKRGDDFAEVVDYIRGRLRTYWSGQGAVGNQGFATFMLSCLGEIPVKKIEVSEKVTDSGGDDW